MTPRAFKSLVYLILTLFVGLVVLDARPSSSRSGGSRSGGSSHRSGGSSFKSSRPSSYGSTKSFGSSSRPSVSKPSARPQSKAYGSSTNYDARSRSNWGSSKAVPSVTRSSAEKAANQSIKASSQSYSGTNRSSAVKQSTVTSRSVSTRSYNSRVSQSVARSYPHYYASMPSVWPMGMPYSYFWMGMTYQLMWDPFYHSYGWYGPGRQWVYYDAAVRGEDSGEVVAESGQGAPPARVYVRQSSGWGVIVWTLSLLTIFGLFVWLAVYLYRRERVVVDTDDEIETETTETTETVTTRPIYPAPAPSARWSALHRGSVIYLKDPISLKDARALGKSRLKITVDRVLHVKERSSAAQWTFIYGTSDYEGQAVLLKVKTMGGTEVAVCYTPDIESTDRQSLLDTGTRFMFANPGRATDPENLAYAKSFTVNLSGEKDETFGMIHPSELHGLASDETIITVGEWRNTRRAGNEYLVIESDGGLEGWWGDSLAVNDIVT